MIFDSPLALRALREVAAGELVVVDWPDARGVALVIGTTAGSVHLIPLTGVPGGSAAMAAITHAAQPGERCLSYGHDWVLRPAAPPGMIVFETDPGHGAGVVHLTDAGPLLAFHPDVEAAGAADGGAADGSAADGSAPATDPPAASPLAGYNLQSGGLLPVIAPPYAAIFDWDLHPSARAAAAPAAKPLVSFRYKGLE